MKNILIIFLLSANSLFAQNLIPNHSFESVTFTDSTTCSIQSIANWYSPNLGTPDYFNKKSKFSECGTPKNFRGFQMPYEGDKYICLALFAYNGLDETNDLENEYEYLQVRLISPTKIGRVYKLHFSISYANFDSSFTQISSNKISAQLTQDKIIINDYFSPFINSGNFSSEFVFSNLQNDTSSWMQLEKKFTADSSFNYLTIGNFFPHTLVMKDTLFKSTSSYVASFYFIDDVSLIEIPDTIIINNNNEMNIYNDNGSTYFNYSLAEAANNAAIEVYNTWGQKVMEYTNLQQQNTITVNNNLLSSAMYFVVLSNNNKKLITKKWVVW